jgi:hypothetical protein
MAAGLTAHVWTLHEVLWFHVPPWPQPQLGEGMGKEEDRESLSEKVTLWLRDASPSDGSWRF